MVVSQENTAQVTLAQALERYRAGQNTLAKEINRSLLKRDVNGSRSVMT
jgi:hypothetical protein